ncbi:MAG: PEP-CTERM sorting domain-containing protein [Pyrinomonadaceae bacterium]
MPAQAGTIQFGDVIALATVNGHSGRQTVDLRLRSVTQSRGASSQDGQNPSANGNGQDRNNGQTPTVAAPVTSADTNITGTAVAMQEPGSVQVETIELGDITGTICDCGEIPGIPGGFPRLPLLALAGLPLLFLGGGDDSTPPGDFVIIPPPTPIQETPIPEPATLLLFGSGLAALGAGARRRRAARSNIAGRGVKNLDAREV